MLNLTVIMKNNWQTKKLSELSKRKNAVVSGPFGSNLKVSDYINEGVPILRLQNIGKGFFINKDIKYISKIKAEELKYHYFISGDIALAKLGIPIGKTCIIPNNITSGIITADIVRIRPDKNTINYNFLEYVLNADISVNQLIKNISGATRPRVNLSEVRNLQIPLPPLTEQHRIVKILDEVFADVAKAKENAEKNLRNAKELFESYLQSVFANPGKDWEEKKLGDIGKVSMCKRVFKHQTTKTGDIPFYKIGTFGKEPNAYISNKIYNEFRKKFSFPKKGDILISASGTIGRRVKYDGEPAYFQDSNIVWIDNDENQIINDYLYHFYGACNWDSTKGATISRLYNDNLKQIKIAFPKSLSEQKSIVAKLDALSTETKKLEAIYKQKLANLEELKKSVLNKAFAGEL